MKKHLPLWLSAASFVGVLILGIYILRSDTTSSKAVEPVYTQVEQTSSDIQSLERKLKKIEKIVEWNEYEISELEDQLNNMDMMVEDLESEVSHLESQVSYLEMEIQ